MKQSELKKLVKKSFKNSLYIHGITFEDMGHYIVCKGLIAQVIVTPKSLWTIQEKIYDLIGNFDLKISGEKRNELSFILTVDK